MARVFILLSLIYVSTFVNAVLGDYQCVCNHHTQRGVFSSPSTGSAPLAFLYKDECKALVWLPNVDSKWRAIQFYHTIGYIQADSGIDIILCQGQIPDEDKVSTISPPPTTQRSSTSKGVITTSSHTATNKVSGGSVALTSTPQYTYSSGKASSGPTAGTSAPQHTYSSIQTSQTITVSSRRTTASFQSTAIPVLKGHTELCPRNVQLGAHLNGFLLVQYQHSCFEVCRTPVSWSHAESMCKGRGGHLATLSNLKENNYLHEFLQNHFDTSAVWIGLNDRGREGHFQWSSGQHVSFTNWSKNRQNYSHGDCAIMLKDGTWDEYSCGSDFIFTEFTSTRFPYVCSYSVHPGYALIG